MSCISMHFAEPGMSPVVETSHTKTYMTSTQLNSVNPSLSCERLLVVRQAHKPHMGGLDSDNCGRLTSRMSLRLNIGAPGRSTRWKTKRWCMMPPVPRACPALTSFAGEGSEDVRTASLPAGVADLGCCVTFRLFCPATAATWLWPILRRCRNAEGSCKSPPVRGMWVTEHVCHPHRE